MEHIQLSKTPLISESIFSIAPDFRALSIHVEVRGDILNPHSDSLKSACEYVYAGYPSWAEDHMDSWARVYSKFGAKPNRTPCSAQALRKRVLKDGVIPSINPIVDLYNAVSLRFAVPIGGENLDAYVGQPQLTISDGTEIFDTKNNGVDVEETPLVGEIIWRDNVGVTCRRWNWRQGNRTRLDKIGGSMWFILESLSSMPEAALDEAGEMLIEGLSKIVPHSFIVSQKLTISAHQSVEGSS